MNGALSLAVITFKEGIRNRALFGIVLMAMFLFGLNISVANFFMRDVGKVTVDMNLSALTFAGLLLVLFVGINLMAKDIDRKTIHLVLSKPISRTQYIFGKYLGILFFIAASLFLLFILSCLTILLLQSMYSNYFSSFSWLMFFYACFFVYMKLAVLSAIVVFFSSITSSSLITLIFSVSIYVAGATIEEVVFYVDSQLSAKEQLVSDSLRTFIDMLSYLLPNFSVFDFSLEAAHNLAVTVERFSITIGYGVLYSFITLALASILFARREFN